MDRILTDIRASELLQPGMHVIVGFSGGPDSLCLLHALNRLPEELNLIPVHVNHQLRENADSEQRHAEALCREMGLLCRSRAIDCRSLAAQWKVSVEEAGRKARYQIFSETGLELVRQGVPKEKIYIALAHNSDDQCETVLQRIIRGTGIHGLSGIPKVRSDAYGFHIIRPLIRVPRREIEAYLTANGLHPNCDESNECTDYTRNRIRLELLPYLEENFNPNVRVNLQTLSEIAGSDDRYMEKTARFVLEEAVKQKIPDQVVLDNDVLKEQDPAILRRVITVVLRSMGLESEVRYSMILGIQDIILSENPSVRMSLPDHWIVSRAYSELVFRPEASGDQPLIFPKMSARVLTAAEFKAAEKNVYAAFDYESFVKAHPAGIQAITVRGRAAGDRIGIRDGKHKKIQDVLVDEKVPKDVRDRMALAAAEHEILWILPDNAFPNEREKNKGKYSQNYPVTRFTKQVLFLELLDRL